MKRNNLTYYLREGFRGIGMHGFMSFAAICIIVACLVITGTFCMMLVNVRAMLEQYESESEILVYIDENYSTAEAHSVGSKINRVANVRRADFVTREEALEAYMAKFEDTSIFEGTTADDFRDRFQVYLDDLSQMELTKSHLEEIEGVAEVTANADVAEGFTTVRNILRVVSIIVISVLLVISLFIISNTIKLALMSRREEIGIMRMVGATNHFIRWPFIIEGLLLGLTGAILAFFLQWFLYELVCSKVSSLDVLHLLTLLDFESMEWLIGSVCLGVGVLIGVLGSLMSIRRFLRV